MKTIFIFLMTIFFPFSLFSYEYNFIDAHGQKKLFINSHPYSTKIDRCIYTIAYDKNHLVIDNKKFVYMHESNLLIDDCNSNISILEQIKGEVKSEIVYKNRLYLYIDDSIWVTNGTKEGTYKLKDDIGIVSFNTTNYNLYILEYVAVDELKTYIVDKENRTLKRVLKGITIPSSRFAHFGKPVLFVTRLGTLFKMNEITFDIEIINEQDNVFYPSFLVPLSDKLLHFVSEKGEIYITNGTDEGTKIIKTFRDTKRDVYFQLHTLTENKIEFFTTDDKQNQSLYETDGTIEGTVFVKSIDN